MQVRERRLFWRAAHCAAAVLVVMVDALGAQTLAPYAQTLTSKNPVSPELPSGAADETPYTDVPFNVADAVAGNRSIVAVLVADREEAAFSLELVDKDGMATRGSVRPASQQQLVIPRDQASGHLRIRREDAGEAARVQLSIRTFDQSEETELTRSLAAGYLYREQLSLYDYSCWVAFAERAGTAEPPSTQCDRPPTLEEMHSRVLSSLSLSSCARCINDPLIVFYGLGGANRILLLWQRNGEMQNPLRVSLETARGFWAVYVEDDAAPYETSIDVEFRDRAASTDYEEFNPATTQPRVIGGLADQPSVGPMSVRRAVRVGVRRFVVRQAPIAVNVAFTRQGASYGVRQWQRAFRAFSSRWFTFMLTVMVPAREVSVSQYHQSPVVPLSGAPPTRGELVHSKAWFPVFATVVMSGNRWRARAFGEGVLQNFIHPDWQVGVGLPAERVRAIYGGGSWPLTLPLLRVSFGIMARRQQTLNEGLFEGQTVPLGAEWQTYSDKQWKYGVLFGLSVDLVRTRW